MLLGFALDQLRGYHTLAGTGLSLALLSAGAHLEWHRRAAMLAFSATYAPLAVALFLLGPEGWDEFAGFYLACTLVWGIGAWLRSTRRTEAERRRLVAEETRTAERTRIARELHDVVTHHVTAMVVQAEAARYLTAVPERLDQALTATTDTGRRALTDLRHLLDLLSTPTTTRTVPRPERHPWADFSPSWSRRAGPGSQWSSPRRAHQRSRPAVPIWWPTALCRRL